MSRTHEEVVNTWITYLIERLVPRTTEPPSGRIRLDTYYFNIVIESFYDKKNVRFAKTLIEVIV